MVIHFCKFQSELKIILVNPLLSKHLCSVCLFSWRYKLFYFLNLIYPRHQKPHQNLLYFKLELLELLFSWRKSVFTHINENKRKENYEKRFREGSGTLFCLKSNICRKWNDDNPQTVCCLCSETFFKNRKGKRGIWEFFTRISLIGGLIIKFSERMWILTTLSVGVHLFSFTILQVEICIHCYLRGEN